MKRKSGPKPLPRIPCPCPICGTVRLMVPSRVKGRLHVYCSRPCRDIGHQKHGETDHGVLSPEYKIWRSLKDRCFNPKNAKFKDYGGRGITLYPPWRDDFPAFLAEVGRRPSPELTLERIDNAAGYFPGNLKWSSRKEQALNRRSNHLLTFNGVTKCLSEWAETAGLTHSGLTSRLKMGLSVEEALTRPPRYKKSPIRMSPVDREQNPQG